jgi:hypothetical protein
MFPKIDSPCPARVQRLPSDGQNHCTLCDRQVHNLDGMRAEQRAAFLQSCSGKVCVAYSVNRKIGQRQFRNGALIAAAVLFSGQALAEQVEGEAVDEMLYEEIFVGSISRPDNVLYIPSTELPILPVLDADAPELEFIAPPET